ncbi:MAG: aconitate hydratase AcnA [Calditrichaceae bacterium]|nr:aconitate hydratase AcnA [Calditrichia bacterium]NUQ41671.1 aconitate hydratase AcnA [Calditrichaceae bacterium]
MALKNSFGILDSLSIGNKSYQFFNLKKLEDQKLANLSRLPFSIRVLLENLLRNEDGRLVTRQDVEKILEYDPRRVQDKEIPFMPARVVLQDFTGVPAVVDLAVMRDAMVELKGNPSRINPIVRADLVIDHSVQVDAFGNADAFLFNTRMEFERNKERYALMRWAQGSFRNFSVVPPGTGIVHQVNLEYLASVVMTGEAGGETVAYPDTLVGTDSHTTMINGLSVLGWGVGGIEAEAVMLGQPYYMLLPEVIGFKLTGQLPEGATATDLVLVVTQMLRKKGVVGKFVEFYGSGLSQLNLADRATIANMAPEYGATMGFFPIDHMTLDYLRLTGREDALIQLVEAYAKAQGLFRSDDTPDPVYTDAMELDLSTVAPSLAGPRRPQDRIVLGDMKKAFDEAMQNTYTNVKSDRKAAVVATHNGETFTLRHGSVVIAAITSCTNTSNPSVMVAAGLVAKKALEKGLKSKPWVKTSLAPGSQVVPEYLKRAGLMEALEAQRFHLVGFGCTTCIGNSGPLPEEIDKAVKQGNLVAAAVLSGNRNFEGRVHPTVRANYLASPPLVVAYALAGRVDIDLESEPLGNDQNGKPVFLRDIWPTQAEIKAAVEASLSPEMFVMKYAGVYDGDADWQALRNGKSEIYHWDKTSTYIKKPPFFEDMPLQPGRLTDIHGARVLALLGDSVTTDHISPAGSIQLDSPAGKYLVAHGVEWKDFNSYGSRRGNHEVMMRGTFANIRIKNQLLPGVEGGYTVYFPTGEQMFIYDAAMEYKANGIPLLVIAGKEYGTGSSRDWAAKGTYLLGVKAVIAESYERIHRSNLIGMGVLPLQFLEGDTAQKLGLGGKEIFDVTGLAEDLTPGKEITIRARAEDGVETTFNVRARLDTEVEIDYYRNGGILQTVLRQMLKG